MGLCASNTVKEDAADNKGDAKPEVADKPAANENQGEAKPQTAAEIAKAKAQRRRLSVGPQHVGDITKELKLQVDKPSEIEGDVDATEEERTMKLSALEKKTKGSLRDALKSRKGLVPYNKNKVNQDRAVIKYAVADDPDVTLFAVMDGHGEFGHLVAQFVQEKLVEYLAAETDLKQDPERCITNAVKRMCDQLAESNINIAFSGSTAIFAVKIVDRLYVCNVGDSRCVLCRQNEDGQISAIGLSFDQKPDNPKEKARIIKAGGRVEPLPGPPGEDCGPPRVWLAEVDVPGLAMSRSIGDEVSQSVGVISVPEIIEHQLQGNDIFAVWASDGVWEFVSNAEACAIIWKHRDDYDAAAIALIEESTKRWKQEEEVIDDITCIIVGFNEPKP